MKRILLAFLRFASAGATCLSFKGHQLRETTAEFLQAQSKRKVRVEHHATHQVSEARNPAKHAAPRLNVFAEEGCQDRVGKVRIVLAFFPFPFRRPFMDPIHILRVEVRLFLLSLAALLAYRMLTRKVVVDGLLRDRTKGQAVSPERVQLLLATLALSAQYVAQVAHGSGTALPDVSSVWLGIFGASGGIYAAVKSARLWFQNSMARRTTWE